MWGEKDMQPSGSVTPFRARRCMSVANAAAGSRTRVARLGTSNVNHCTTAACSRTGHEESFIFISKKRPYMITLLSLNVEGSKHFTTVLPFLEANRTDVVCLQEVFEADMPAIQKAVGCDGVFAPMWTKNRVTPLAQEARGVQGVAIFTRLPHAQAAAQFYNGAGDAPPFENGGRDRVLLLIIVEKDGERFTVGTTHFTWTPDGEADDQQREEFLRLMALVPEELVLCGDFNAPRGREIFSRFTERFADNLPQEVTSTIDPELHRKKGLALVVDTIFSTPHYAVTDVRVVAGVSDHKAVLGTISRR